MTDYSAIREEMQGRTGLLKEYEDDLIERIGIIEEIIEKEGAIVPTLNKADLVGIIVLLIAGIGMVVASAVWILGG